VRGQWPQSYWSEEDVRAAMPYLRAVAAEDGLGVEVSSDTAGPMITVQVPVDTSAEAVQRALPALRRRHRVITGRIVTPEMVSMTWSSAGR
jgi:hypothetical protein